MINSEYLKNLNNFQKEAVLHTSGPLLIVAGAGSGKTKVLTSRIANIVEKNLAKNGVKKNELGREKFIEKVWKWKEESGGIILDQLKRLGCSCDWSRTRFTMDKDLSQAVIKVFVDLYNNKLIFKDKKLVYRSIGETTKDLIYKAIQSSI